MQLPINGFKEGAYFILCPKQGHKTEGVVLNRVRILVLFLPETWSGFETLIGSPIPKYWSINSPPPPPAGGPAHPDPKIRDG